MSTPAARTSTPTARAHAQRAAMLAGALYLLLAGPAAARSTPAAEVPPEIREAVTRQLIEAGVDPGQIAQASKLFTPVDLTPQAAPDWLVDFNALPVWQLCGTGGCLLQVWVKTGQTPYQLAFHRQALGHAVVQHRSGRRWLDLELHGINCAGSGSDACRYHFEWHGHADDPEGHFRVASIWGKPLRYEGPLVQAMPAQAPAGSAVAAALEQYRAACTSSGGTAVLDDVLTSLPDLNGDDRPELLLDAGLAYCLLDDVPVDMPCAGDTCHSRLYSRQGSAGWQTVWSGEPFAYAIDFRQPAPRLLIRAADCEGHCPEQVLSWQAGQRRFIPATP